ncbi:hypothetical protein [Paenibacillus mendelii]|uniref:Uncharacterized protein n=1 Tax=Paenibacillus mendelii TaxID=206163 RepID=A0ABV6JBN4_9BACL|nr:hypothetical protein [Paenibacillus mendelii]MCQ6559644.1 hypothetical protein [Paenibacillus mendelii]
MIRKEALAVAFVPGFQPNIRNLKESGNNSDRKNILPAQRFVRVALSNY